jgi:ankyrin repeat protein
MGAAREGHEEIVSILLDNRADINAKSSEGKSARMYAEENGHDGIVEMIDTAGSEEFGFTPTLEVMEGEGDDSS